MSSTERSKFERSWQEAFEGAEATPSVRVWDGIELDLERRDGIKSRKKLVYFQWLAAASVTAAVGIGTLYFMQLDQGIVTPANEITTLQDVPVNPSENNQEQSPVMRGQTPSSGSTGNDNTSGEQPAEPSVQTVAPLVAISDDNHDQEENVTRRNYNRTLPPLSDIKLSSAVTPVEIKIELPSNEPDPLTILLAQLRDEERRFSEEEKARGESEKMWTSIGFGAGTFTPRASAPSSPPQQGIAGISPVTAASDPSTGSSLAFGFSVGGRVSERFIVMGGLTYLTQNSEFNSNSVSLTSQNRYEATLNEFKSQSTVVSAPYKVRNSFQYLSFPIQAGLVLVDKRVGWQVSGGISTDLFIENKLTPDDTRIAAITITNSDNSIYRPVSFSGLIGTELNYKIADRYRIAVNPGLRYSLNSIYKDEVPASVSPLTMDVSLRFRYIFK